MKLNSLILLIISVWHLSAFSDVPVAGERPETTEYLRAELVLEVGRPIELKISDGRVAQVFYQKTSAEFATELKVTENLCTGQINQNCKLHSSITAYRSEMRWTQHPNPEKLGNNIFIEDTFFESTLVLNLFDDFFNLPGFETSPPRLECSEYSWLMEENQTEDFLYSWDIEQNRENEETGVNENQFDKGLMGIYLTQSNRGGFDINFENVYANNQFYFTLPLFFNSQASTIVKEKKGEVCTINLTPDTNKLLAEIVKAIEPNEQADESTWQLYIPSDQRNLNRYKRSMFNLDEEKVSYFNELEGTAGGLERQEVFFQ